MNDRKPKLPFVVIAGYLVAVFLCIIQAFDFAGDINVDWTLVVIGLTLPWSLISIVFAWSLIHGAGLEFFASMYMVFAGLNSLIYYRWYLWALKRRRARSANPATEQIVGRERRERVSQLDSSGDA